MQAGGRACWNVLEPGGDSTFGASGSHGAREDHVHIVSATPREVRTDPKFSEERCGTEYVPPPRPPSQPAPPPPHPRPGKDSEAAGLEVGSLTARRSCAASGTDQGSGASLRRRQELHLLPGHPSRPWAPSTSTASR